MDYHAVNASKPVILIIDGAHMLRRCMYQPGLRDLSNAIGMPTGAVYGFMNSLKSVINSLSASGVIVCHEGGHSERRKQVYEHYKERTPSEEVPRDTHGYTDYEYYKHQLSWVEKLLECMGVTQLRVSGKEGDDVIFQSTRLLKGQKIIVSEDSDFFSVISEDVAVYRPISKTYVDLVNFHDVTGLPTPKHYLYSKVLRGDGSDNIPGICKGVGWKTISDILCKIEDPDEVTPENILKVAASMKGARYQKIVDAGVRPIIRNLDLIDISREEFNLLELSTLADEISTQHYPNVEMATKLCNHLEFRKSNSDYLINRLSLISTYSLAPLIDKDYMKRMMMGITSTLQG